MPDGGDAFVGDLAMSGVFVLRPGLPILLNHREDVDVLRRSWLDLHRAGARRFHPGHGQPFAVAMPSEHPPAA